MYYKRIEFKKNNLNFIWKTIKINIFNWVTNTSYIHFKWNNPNMGSLRKRNIVGGTLYGSRSCETRSNMLEHKVHLYYIYFNMSINNLFFVTIDDHV